MHRVVDLNLCSPFVDGQTVTQEIAHTKASLNTKRNEEDELRDELTQLKEENRTLRQEEQEKDQALSRIEQKKQHLKEVRPWLISVGIFAAMF